MPAAPVVATAPRTEPVTTAAKAPAAESKNKSVTSEEKVQAVAKQVPMTPVKTIAPKTGNVGAQQYTVKPGDTLARLAQQFYNSPSKWGKIYEANKDQVKNPDYIYIGMKLIIPGDA
jgi:nucleoid-associated protein YgaU